MKKFLSLLLAVIMIKLKELAEEQHLSLREVALRSCYRHYQENGYSIETLEDELANLPDPDLFEIYEVVYRNSFKSDI